MRLENKVAIVTGAGQGIGRGIARAYAREGAAVVVAELKEHRAARTADEIRELGGRTLALATDVSRREAVFEMVRRTVAEFGRLDVLVNNAQGMHSHKPFEEITDEDFDVFLVSGLKGTFWAMQAAFPHMKAQGGGRIINMVSLNALNGAPGLADYNATKGAVQALSRTAAREWGKHKILVNCIAPGAASKRGLEFLERNPEAARRILEERPLGRLADPELDLAPVAVFLASDDGHFVTGQTYFVDGGAYLT
ncbi:MAG TPA: SDR family oxidoreductase [Candidatus Binatia bacterium]|nr:SDR family oxidoreductase [Candidatus Binatia bacterium]